MRLNLIKYFFLILFLALTIKLIPQKIYVIEHKVIKTIQGIVTFYSPSIDETDSTPLINASNKTVKTSDIANNCLPFGTRVRIGKDIFTVRDRMAKRWSCLHFDVFVWSKEQAIVKGKVRTKIEILAKI